MLKDDPLTKAGDFSRARLSVYPIVGSDVLASRPDRAVPTPGCPLPIGTASPSITKSHSPQDC